MASLDELNSRTRYLESEIEGEKTITRHIFDSTRRHAEEISAVRLAQERMAGDVALVKTAQISQGQMLNILVQDVGALRNEMAALRAELRNEAAALRNEIAELRAELRNEAAALRADLHDQTAAFRAELRAELHNETAALRAELRNEAAALRAEMVQMRSDTNRRLEMMERNIAAILAIVSRDNRPPA
jgi:ribosomal protein L29